MIHDLTMKSLYQTLPCFFDGARTVYGGPGRYIQGAGALDLCGMLAKGLGLHAIMVTDPDILGLYGARVRASVVASGLDLTVLTVSGVPKPDTAASLLARLPAVKAPVVLACGGGSAIDAGKALAHDMGAPIITMPTAASNDAPTSKNFVLYDDHHRLVDVGHMPKSPAYVLVDTKILASAPRLLFAAGIGDAIAKLSEAAACAAADGRNLFHARPPLAALAIARACEETLLAYGCDAYDAAGTGEVTLSFEAAVEAVVLMAGLAFENGGLSLTHAMTRGLSAVGDTVLTPHGFQVAYGLVVQKALEGVPMDAPLSRLFTHVGLPMSFRELSGRDLTEEEIGVIARLTMSAPMARNFPPGTTETRLCDTLRAVEVAADVLQA